MTSHSSTSGEITSSFENISNVFTSYTEIPSNGFNQLYKAQRYGKWYVLKGLKLEHLNELVYEELLNKEFDMGIQMDHANIARIYSRENDPLVGYCIVMEYIDGCTLKEFLRQRPSFRTRMKITHELLSAMAYYHSKQIIHRDLKPDNILITHNGHNVKLIDFGLADTDYHEIFKQPAGTNKYASPEQVQGHLPLDCRADIYSFGVILKQIFPHRFDSIIHKCTQADRDKRFNNVEEITQRLKRRQSFFPILLSIFALLCVWAGIQIFTPKQAIEANRPNTAVTTEAEPDTETISKNEKAAHTEATPQVETEEAVIAEKNEAQKYEIKGVTAIPTDEVKQDVPAKTEEVDILSEEYIYKKIPVEIKKSIEQSINTLFQPFWDWNKAATARNMSAEDKIAEYTQSNFFKNNYDIRERHRETVINDIMQQNPQCEPIRETIINFYNSQFAKKMIALGKEVNMWERAIRK